MIYFDNAATSFPKPPSVVSAVQHAMLYYGANPGRSGYPLAQKTAKKVFEVREKAADLFGIDDTDGVIFTNNCTSALNIVMKGLLKEGDHVVVSDMEHNSVMRPLFTLKQKGIIDYSVATVHFNDEQTIQSFAAQICSNTRLIICTCASNVFGVIPPVTKIAKLAKENDILFMVDGAQAAGAMDIKLKRDGIDFLAVPGHKGLYGPSGTGMLLMQRLEMLDTMMEGGTGSNSFEYSQPKEYPDRFEAGTINTTGIIGLGAGIDFIMKTGVSAIHQKEMALAEYMYAQMSNIEEVTLYTNKEQLKRCMPVVSFNVAKQTGEETASLLGEKGIALRGGFHCAPSAHVKFGTDQIGTARLSPGYFNNLKQAKQFIEILKKITLK